MDLSALHFLRPSYCTGRDDIVADLDVPCLSFCYLYRFAVAYSTSSGLFLAAGGIEALLDNGGMDKEKNDKMVQGGPGPAAKKGLYALA